MALLVREAGKTLDNAQADLREAVDFLRYYASEARAKFAGPVTMAGPTGERNLLTLNGRGVFACISPWNFPLAIFTGQVAAALAAGNAVIAKPAEQTPLIAHHAVKLMIEAGVMPGALALLPGDGATRGRPLMADRRIAGVAFTGSNETAAIINRALAARDGAIVPLIAETGGMNAMIVDSSALPEQAVRDLVASAFDSAGQRCSAARVLFVQDDIAKRLLPMLTGAMEELVIGDPLDYATDVGPVIDEDARKMLDGHKRRMKAEAKTLIDLPLPAATKGGTFVSPAAYELPDLDTLKREVFGPILHVVRFKGDRLGEVCEAINATGYGLTLGLHTRIEQTVDEVRQRMRVGNFYVNRNQIGAVVGAQPFGGEGLVRHRPQGRRPALPLPLRHRAGGLHRHDRFGRQRGADVDGAGGGGGLGCLCCRLPETVGAEEADGVLRRSLEGKVGEDLADDRRELEAVAAEAGGIDEAGKARVAVDDEVVVRRHGVDAGEGAFDAAIGVRHVGIGKCRHLADVGLGDFAPDAVGCAHIDPVVAHDLDAFAVEMRKAGEDTLRGGPEIDRHGAGIVQARLGGVEMDDRDAPAADRQVEVGQGAAGPRTHRDDDAAGGNFTRIGADDGTATRDRPPVMRLHPEAQFAAMPPCLLPVGIQAGFGLETPPLASNSPSHPAGNAKPGNRFAICAADSFMTSIPCSRAAVITPFSMPWPVGAM